MEAAQQIHARWCVGWEADSRRSNHSVFDCQRVSALELDTTLVVYEHAMAGCHPNGAAIGSPNLEELLFERVANDTLDRAEPDRVVVESETQNLADAIGGQLIHAAASALIGQLPLLGLGDAPGEFADAHHANAAVVCFYETVIVAVDAHDDNAVITQFIHVEIVATDAATQGGDERADFR